MGGVWRGLSHACVVAYHHVEFADASPYLYCISLPLGAIFCLRFAGCHTWYYPLSIINSINVNMPPPPPSVPEGWKAEFDHRYQAW